MPGKCPGEGLQWRPTCSGAGGRGTLVQENGFKCGIQFQDDAVEVLQGDVEIVVSAVAMATGRLRSGTQSNRLAHSQNVVGHHVGHAFSCKHHVSRADCPGRLGHDRHTTDSFFSPSVGDTFVQRLCSGAVCPPGTFGRPFHKGCFSRMRLLWVPVQPDHV